MVSVYLKLLLLCRPVNFIFKVNLWMKVLQSPEDISENGRDCKFGKTFMKWFVLEQIEDWNQYRKLQISLTALVYYRGPIVLADFEIIPILIYLNLTDPWFPHPTEGSAPLNPLPSPWHNFL
jgi:hypothetical protein